MADVTQPREHLVRALQADLVGPYRLDDSEGFEETLELPPSRHYLTGFLAPEEERDPEDSTADDTTGAGSDEPEEEGEEADSKRKNLWPASLGLSLLVRKETKALEVTVQFAEYVLDVTKPEGRGRGKREW